MQRFQPHEDLVAFTLPKIDQRNPPALRISAERVLERIGAGDWSPAEFDDLVAISQTAAEGIGRFEDIRHDDRSTFVRRHGRSERRVIDDATTAEVTQESLDLVHGDGVADADIDTAAFLKRATPVDADQFPLRVEQGPARVAGVDGCIGLDAVGVFQNRTGRILIAVDAGDDAEGYGGAEVGGQQERIAGGETLLSDAHRVAVGDHGGGKVVAAQELDQSHVARGVDAHHDRVVEFAVIHATLHVVTAGLGHMEVRQCVTIGRDHHAGSAARRLLRPKDRQGRHAGPLHGRHARILRGAERCGQFRNHGRSNGRR